MADVTMRTMLEAGVHFGHQTRFWNPKMLPFIFGDRNKIHIINLEKTLPLYRDAINFIGRMAESGGTILFVGTKRASQQIIAAEAKRCGMPYVDRRWLGGMLTNFRTVKQSINRLKELESMLQEEGGAGHVSKKERLSLQRELMKLERSLGGIKHMERLPDVLFIIDVGHEKIAVAEAVKLAIPVAGVVDTNNDPDGVDYVVPGNDDAIRSIELYVQGVADAVIDGRTAAQLAVAATQPEAEAAPAEAAAEASVVEAALDAESAASAALEAAASLTTPVADAAAVAAPAVTVDAAAEKAAMEKAAAEKVAAEKVAAEKVAAEKAAAEKEVTTEAEGAVVEEVDATATKKKITTKKKVAKKKTKIVAKKAATTKKKAAGTTKKKVKVTTKKTATKKKATKKAAASRKD